MNIWEVIYMAINGQRFYTHEFFDQYPNIEDNTMQEQVQNIRQFLEQVPLADRMGFLNTLRIFVNQQYEEIVEADDNHNVPPAITQGMTSLINAVNQVANEIGNNGHNHGQPAHEQGNGGELGLL